VNSVQIALYTCPWADEHPAEVEGSGGRVDYKKYCEMRNAKVDVWNALFRCKALQINEKVYLK